MDINILKMVKAIFEIAYNHFRGVYIHPVNGYHYQNFVFNLLFFEFPQFCSALHKPFPFAYNFR